MNDCLKIVGDRAFRFGGRRRALEGRNRKEIVDRCRFRRLFCEAIRLRQSHEFVAADPLDQAVVVRTQLRVRTGAAGRFEQNVNRAVERSGSRIEVTFTQLAFTRLEMLV